MSSLQSPGSELAGAGAVPVGSGRLRRGAQLAGGASGCTGSGVLGERPRVASSGLGAAQRRQGGKDEDLGPEWGSELQSRLPTNLRDDLGGGGWVQPASDVEGKSPSDLTAQLWKLAASREKLGTSPCLGFLVCEMGP